LRVDLGINIREGNVVSTESTPGPSNDEIMLKLKQIEKHVEKIEKKLKDINGWFWAILIGGLIGFCWDDIINFFRGIGN
jgi:hypothetical protein